MAEQQTFVTSDTHFGHANIIKYSKRPFRDVHDMDEQLIQRWNAKVPSNSIVYHIGDFAFAEPSRLRELVRRLNGTIRLVRGNHDKRIRGDDVKLFDWVRDYYEAAGPGKRKIVMCHYPMVTWNKSHAGSWMLHGHCHGNLTMPETTRLDVGVDTHPNYEPYSLNEITRIMAKRTYLVADHHKAVP